VRRYTPAPSFRARFQKQDRAAGTVGGMRGSAPGAPSDRPPVRELAMRELDGGDFGSSRHPTALGNFANAAPFRRLYILRRRFRKASAVWANRPLVKPIAAVRLLTSITHGNSGVVAKVSLKPGRVAELAAGQRADALPGLSNAISAGTLPLHLAAC
jgi:hypothetical protein